MEGQLRYKTRLGRTEQWSKVKNAFSQFHKDENAFFWERATKFRQNANGEGENASEGRPRPR